GPAGGREHGPVEGDAQGVGAGHEGPPVGQQPVGGQVAGEQVPAGGPAQGAAVLVGDQQVFGAGVRAGDPLGGGVGGHDGVRGEFECAGGQEGQPADAAVGAEEVLHEGVRGRGQQVGGRRVLGEPAALPEDGDHGAQLDGLVDVVGDEDDRLAQFVLDPQEFVLQSLADHGVDGGE